MNRNQKFKLRRRSRSQRNQNGAMGSVLLLVVLQFCFVATALSVDTAKHICVQSELHAAADAAALAGEQIILAQPTGGNGRAVNSAVAMANSNIADGRRIGSNSSANVGVEIASDGGTPALPTTRVTVSVRIRNMFGILIGRPTDTVSATSVAGAGQVNTSFTTFPLSVVNRDYKPNTTYTWYISDVPGLAPSIVTALSSGLTGASAGSSLSPYPSSMLGYNTARFLTTINGNVNGGLGGAVTSTGDGVGGLLGLGSPGTVLGGVLNPTISSSGGTVSGLLQGMGGLTPGADRSALSMLSYYSQKATTGSGGGYFQLTASTRPASNGGSFPAMPSPLAPPSLTVGQQVFLTSGASSASNNILNTTAQYLQGSSGNRPIGSPVDVNLPGSYQVTAPGLPSASSNYLQGSVATWLQGQTVILPVSTPIPAQSKITVPILNINLLGTADSTTSTYSGGATGLLGPVVQPLVGVRDATPITAMVDRFIAVKIKSVTVEYRGANGINLLFLNLLGDPWAQQVVRITGEVQSNAGFAGYGGSSHGETGSTGAYAAMLIQ